MMLPPPTAPTSPMIPASRIWATGSCAGTWGTSVTAADLARDQPRRAAGTTSARRSFATKAAWVIGIRSAKNCSTASA